MIALQLQAFGWVLPAVPYTDRDAHMAGEDVGPPGAADAGIQTPVMCPKSLYLRARLIMSTSADP